MRHARELRTGKFTAVAATATAAAATTTTAPTEAARRAESRACRLRVDALCTDATVASGRPWSAEAPAVRQIRALASALSLHPMDAALADEFTRLAVVARHARCHGGAVRCPHYAAVLEQVGAHADARRACAVDE